MPGLGATVIRARSNEKLGLGSICEKGRTMPQLCASGVWHSSLDHSFQVMPCLTPLLLKTPQGHKQGVLEILASKQIHSNEHIRRYIVLFFRSRHTRLALRSLPRVLLCVSGVCEWVLDTTNHQHHTQHTRTHTHTRTHIHTPAP